MYTPQSLLEESVRQESIYSELLKQFPAGTYHEDRNNARKLMSECLNCAQWMESNGHKELAHVGNFMSAPFNVEMKQLSQFSDTKVRIKSGAIVRCTDPKISGKFVTQRSRVVKLRAINRGYFRGEGPQNIHQAQAVWSGTGGYWYYADLNDVELI